jgi:hypothetical protein
MGMDAQNRVELTPRALELFQQCAAELAACGFGKDGPPLETTFAQIEAFGHEVGRMMAQAVDEKLTAQHAEYFQGQCQCPTCQHHCERLDDPLQRMMQTTDGFVSISEPFCHCPVCDRDFFPSANRFED